MGSFLRRPLDLFIAIVVVGLILIAGGMKAFGGFTASSQAPSLTQAQFVRLGEGVCVSLRQQLKEVRAASPRNLRQAARPVRLVTWMFDGLVTKLGGLRLPPSADRPSRHLVATLEMADHALHRLDRLTETHQAQRATLLVRSGWWRNISERLRSSGKTKAVQCGRVRHTGGVLTAIRTRAFVGMSVASRYSAKPLSPAQFALVGQRVCVSVRQQLLDVTRDPPTTVLEATEKVQRITNIFDGLIAGLEGLVPPPAEAAPFRRLLGNLKAADAAMHNVNNLTALAEWKRAARLVRSTWWRNIGRGLGPPVSPEDLRCD
jgi:hypothetical protein